MKCSSHIGLLVALTAASTGALAFEFKGVTLEAAIEELEARGLSVLYSSDLVGPEMRVLHAPASTAPRALLEEIVRPHGVQVAEGPGGSLVLMRAPRAQIAGTPQTDSTVSEIIVTASRYAWVRVPHASLTRLSDAEMHLAPNVGDDPLRTLARLPGTAASDLSAKLNLRGGVDDEILVRFDGMRLMNPFHLKDFQSIFSAVSPALTGTIDFYTGGFPVNYGDRMSGVIDIHPVRADADTYREVTLSLYNASALAACRFDQGRGDWAISARRGNLDRVLEWSGMKLGGPMYSDIYGHVAHSIGDPMSLAANILRFDDDIELTDSDAEEQARARYRDRYLWVRLDAYTKRYFDLHPRSENILNDVVILPELKPDRMRLEPSQARAHGIELSLRSVRSRPLFWWASSTWSRAEDIYDQHAVPRGWDQRHTVHSGVGWESEHWEMSLVAAWRSGWPQPALVLDTEGETPIVRTNLASDDRLGTYIDVDARIARRFRFGDDSSLTAFFEISNAFNRRNECCTEFELDDESEEPVLVLESIRSLPLLPSLGVIWRF